MSNNLTMSIHIDSNANSETQIYESEDLIMMNKLFNQMMEQFNSLESNMTDYKTLTKKVIKSISKSDKTHGSNQTCMDLVLNRFNDVIFDDLTQEIAMFFLQYADSSNTRVASSIATHRLIPVFEDWTIDGKTRNGYYWLCAVINRYLEKNKSPNVELCPDAISTGDDDTDIATPNRLADYLRIASINADIMSTYENDSINEFFEYVRDNVKKDLYPELRTFSFMILNGLKINVVAARMAIPENRAYWLRKKVAALYQKYNQIERKVVCFAKVPACSMVYENVKASDNICDKDTILKKVLKAGWTYKRVYPQIATMTTCGKSHKTTVYTGTQNGNDIVIPIDGTRIKKYVINMSKDAIGNQFKSCAFRMPITPNSGFLYETGRIGKSEIDTLDMTSPAYWEVKTDYHGNIYRVPAASMPLPKSSSFVDEILKKELHPEYLGQASESVKRACEHWKKMR